MLLVLAYQIMQFHFCYLVSKGRQALRMRNYSWGFFVVDVLRHVKMTMCTYIMTLFSE